jgi:MFS family permease
MIRWIWRAWKLRKPELVLGTVAGVVAGFVTGPSLPGGWGVNPIHIIFFGSCGAVVGFLLGIAIPPLWHRGGWWKATLASAVGSMVGTVAGTVIGVLLLLLNGGVGSSDGSSLVGFFLIVAFFAVVGFLLGLAIPLVWHRRKLRRAGRQSGKGPVEHSAEAGPLGEGSGASCPRG